ncbi:MAG TPA: DUF202 domain-containing protein [Candidatus Obscuribacterales bacterium]
MTSQQGDLHTNDDERVRDHLANERTYLAWIRTGVATMGLGVVIAKLKYVLGANYPARESTGVIHAAHIGIFFAVIGLATIGMAVFFYLRTQNEIRSRTYRPHKAFAIVLATLMVVLGIVILWYLVQPTT